MDTSLLGFYCSYYYERPTDGDALTLGFDNRRGLWVAAGFGRLTKLEKNRNENENK
jgi:hypothetical protein